MAVFLPHVFDTEEVQMYNRSHRNGVSSCSLASTLPATLAAGLAAFLVENLVGGLAPLGALLGKVLARDCSPCGKHFASRTSHMKYIFHLPKTLASPHTHQHDQHAWLKLQKKTKNQSVVHDR